MSRELRIDKKAVSCFVCLVFALATGFASYWAAQHVGAGQSFVQFYFGGIAIVAAIATIILLGAFAAEVLD